MNALLAQFIPEARDLLEQAGVGMLALEQDATSASVINDVFRAVHTLKGSSGLFDVAPLTRLVHAAEDLLDEVRTGDIALTSDIVDRLLDSLDLVSRWIDVLETREELPGDAETSMTALVTTLRACRANHGAGEQSPGQGASVAQARRGAPDWLAGMAEADRLKAFKAATADTLLAWSFTPEENCFFRGDDPVAMLRHSPGLLAFRAFPREPFPPFAAFDPLTSVLCFEVLSDATRAELEEHMRYVVENIDVREIEPSDLIGLDGLSDASFDGAALAVRARAHLDAGDRAALDALVAARLANAAPASLQASALRWCQAHLDRYGLDHRERLASLLDAVATGAIAAGPSPSGEADAESAARPGEGPEDRYYLVARTIAAEQIRVIETPADPALVAGRLESVAVVLKNLGKAVGIEDTEREVDAAMAGARANGELAPLKRFVGRFGAPANAPEPRRVERAPTATPIAAVKPAQAPLAEERAESAPDGKPVPRVLRVDQAKIDEIMNLVAELIVAKNGLSYLASRAEEVHGSRAMAREIKDQFAVIDRITQGLQVGVMSVRMMPVSQVLQRFPRLVRDIARKLEKKIDLVIEGEETEADKNVLESLADPLIHVVRNSLDHGLETPAERRAAGKSETGTLRIVARQENDFVVIEGIDDGRGIDPEKVKGKALRLGLISPDKAEHMSDAEAVNLVFAPGFSTKEEVSDLSGRGVGLDVVRSTVLKAGGEVALRSTLGTGTCITIRLPLTMAVTRIVTIACRDQIFGIPMDLVVETVRIKRDAIHRIKDMETFVLRDAIIPLVRLADALRLPETADATPASEVAVMVARIGGDRVGVVVDGFRERLEVIVKPLEGVLEGMSNFSGTALLGDGRVLLVLDLQELV